MNKFASAQRSIVTVDDRRTAFVAAKGRKPRDIVNVPNEAFIRHLLKDRMGWGHREPAPESVKAVAREMAAALRPKVAVTA
jgi:hypothetical protein